MTCKHDGCWDQSLWVPTFASSLVRAASAHGVKASIAPDAPAGQHHQAHFPLISKVLSEQVLVGNLQAAHSAHTAVPHQHDSPALLPRQQP